MTHTVSVGNRLFIVCGKPGVGKSTYGSSLSKRHKAVFLDIDTVTEPVVKAGMALAGLDVHDRDSTVYKTAYRLPVYESLFAAARDNLAINSVVICGPFTKEVQNPDWVAVLTSQFNCAVEVHYLTCDEGVRLERISVRGNPRDGAKLKAPEKMAGYYADNEKPACPHLLIKTDEA